MEKNRTADRYVDLKENLRIDCGKCRGLCCVALYCTKTDGFPADKEAGVPCTHLTADFRCDMHAALARKGMKGCLGYDCFGAGQKATRLCQPHADWTAHPDKSSEMFGVFLAVLQLHQMQWYLLEALPLIADTRLHAEIEAHIVSNEQMTALPPHEILQLDTTAYRAAVNQTLKQVIAAIAAPAADGANRKDYFGKNFKRANLSGWDFSMAFLIAANLEGCGLRRTNFLGADLRDVNIRNTDLSAAVFLTQMQINSAHGNANTTLPAHLSRPTTW